MIFPMNIKHIAAASAAIAIVGFGAVAGAVSLSESASAATTTVNGHSWSELLASTPQPAFHR
jgi:hypothetical protein